MAVLTYNNYLRQLLSKYECILAFDTAADFLGLTNGGYRSAAQIFVTKKQNIEGTEQIKIDSFEQIECQEYHGPGVRHFPLPKNFLKPYFRLIFLSNFPYFYVVCAVCI